MHLVIPKKHQQALFALLTSSTEAFKSFLKGLEELQGDISDSGLKSITSVIPELSEIDESILGTVLIGLIRTRGSQTHGGEDEFIDQVINALDAVESPEEKSTARENLKYLLAADGDFRYYVKANDLAYEHANILQETRIVTDVRPIFSDDEECTAIRAIICHTLKVTYSDSSGHNCAQYFTLDENDLHSLKRNIDRALKKDRAIKSNALTEKIKVITI